ncbi:hypothetical protein HQ590_03520 [bacterium]|nr:hypothetical protein [bacterium]
MASSSFPFPPQAAVPVTNEAVAPDKVRAVAFAIEDKVYAGRTNESHTMLYLRLLRENLVSASTLDTWTGEESSHGFVTETGEFLDRPTAFARFGTTRSEDLKAGGHAPDRCAGGSE